MNDSHNSCVSSVASITNELGFASIVELTTDDESSIRPDITTYFASCTVQSDLTLRWPCALTHVRNPLLLEHAEKAKHRKYDAAASRAGDKFMALACDRYGRLGKEFLKFIGLIVKEAVITGSYVLLAPTPRQLRRVIISRIVCAIAKANAVAICRSVGLVKSVTVNSSRPCNGLVRLPHPASPVPTTNTCELKYMDDMIESSDPNVMNMPNDMNAIDDSNRLPAAHPQQPSEPVSILSSILSPLSPLSALSTSSPPSSLSLSSLSLTSPPVLSSI
jgi:hypothetical protein